MTTVLDFRAYYLRRVWREGDTALISDFPLLVKEAEARISRDFREWRLVNSATEVVPSNNYFDLPADFGEMLSLSVAGRPYTAIGSADFLRLPARCALPNYSLSAASVFFNRGDVTDPVTVDYTYYMNVQPMDFVADGAEAGFYDLHPDFFLAALDVQVYTYMRDFDLSAENNSKYGGLLETMQRDSNYKMFPSGQLGSPMPSGVA